MNRSTRTITFLVCPRHKHILRILKPQLPLLCLPYIPCRFNINLTPTYPLIKTTCNLLWSNLPHSLFLCSRSFLLSWLTVTLIMTMISLTCPIFLLRNLIHQPLVPSNRSLNGWIGWLLKVFGVRYIAI